MEGASPHIDRVIVDAVLSARIRAVGNLVGNRAATAVIAAWEGDLHRAQAVEVLNGAEPADATV